MISKHISELIQKLKEKTENRKLKWLQSSRETEYQCLFSGGTVTSDCWAHEYGTSIDLVIYNKDGGRVERVYFDHHDPEYNELFELYKAIKNSATKADETFGSLFDELDKL